MDNFVRVAATGDFAEGVVRAFRVGGDEVAVVAWRGGFYAFENVCNHSSYSFTGLELYGTALLECAAHSAIFDVASGAVCRGPAGEGIPTYDVRVVDGFVHVGPRRASS